MKIYILTIFPELFSSYLNHGLVAKAQKNNLLEFKLVNFRDFTKDLHRTVDDIPYGGRSGMVIKPEPVINAFKSIPESIRVDCKSIVPSARGVLFTQKYARELAQQKSLVFFSGRYKGFDQRIVYLMNAKEFSVGDYVLQGGELPTMIMIDAIIRNIPGFLADELSSNTDSFSSDVNILSAFDFTRPREFLGKKVPDVLFSGNHKAIDEWRRKESIRLTLERRPDLIQDADLTDID